MRTLICLIATFLVALPAAGEIYRTVDEHGNVEFTDVPPPDDHTKRVEVEPVNSYGDPEIASIGAGAEGPESAGATLDANYYATVEIVDPTNDEAIRENAGNLVVAVAISPPLRGDHRMVLSLDGRDLDSAADGRVFVLSNVDRGSHTAVVKVVDGAGAVVTQSAPVTFHMLRAVATRKVTPVPAKKAS